MVELGATLTIDLEAAKLLREQMQERLRGTRIVVDPNPMIQELTEWFDEDGRHLQQLLSMRRANVWTIVHFATGRVDFHPNLDGIHREDIPAVRRMLKLQRKWLNQQLSMIDLDRDQEEK